MKTLHCLLAVALLTLAFGITGWAYEGGTKLVAVVNHPEQGEQSFGPILLVSHDSLTPGKAVTRFFHRIPQSSLSRERIREERPLRTMGTKGVTEFWKKGRI